MGGAIPDLPGEVIPPHSNQALWIKSHVARICLLDHERFPGSQPVSFGSRDLDKLESEDYWVCEKSDGIRVLLLIQTDLVTKDQSTYIIDRHNTYRHLLGLFFPHHENPLWPLRNTLVDGELVLDVDPKTHKETLRFLAFDCLVVDDQNVMSKPLDKRYGRLNEWFYRPFSKMLKDHPAMAESQPFEKVHLYYHVTLILNLVLFSLKVKDINFSYHVEKVFSVDIPALQHGNDGLIYTCVNTPYTSGTDRNIMKWKPPSENSIDFKLVLRFPPTASNPGLPDFYEKPFFGLHVWKGGDRGSSSYELYDELFVTDDEWEEMKKSGEQYDDRIVEVHWDADNSHWRMMRFRNDKPNGNHKDVVENIIQSIADGVEKDALLSRSNSIRNAWKSRHGAPQQPQAPSSAAPLPSASSSQAPPLTSSSGIAKLRYGPLAQSRYSKVSGPSVVAGMNR